MAESVKASLGQLLLGTCCVLGIAKPVCAGENLPDPMRPPASLHAGGYAASSGPAQPVLQSVIISPGRKVAVINGETVQVGGMSVMRAWCVLPKAKWCWLATDRHKH